MITLFLIAYGIAGAWALGVFFYSMWTDTGAESKLAFALPNLSAAVSRLCHLHKPHDIPHIPKTSL